ncbi:hypothetical protein L2E82_43003 [Cichorium intybus]|uniref:Uncharacterized protein n=1 Tax=Cichorium intybus TaxID=13427 RepID=A0ACB8ZNY6_CICIN|nr:hypothetical protein L2E82_43003 [Cichorium intybus]
MVIVNDLFNPNSSGPQVHFQSNEDAKNKLEIFLNQKVLGPMLLVLDDVWSESFIDNFPSKNSGCKILVTSRTAFANYDVFKFDPLKEKDAKTLFCRSASTKGGKRPSPIINENLVNQKVGPWGSSGGDYPYEFIPNGRITKIKIKTGGHGGCIDSITFAYIDENSGQEYWSKTYGGPNGHLSQYMYMEAGEELAELSGSVGEYGGWTVVTSLCFKTNKQRREFGSVSDKKFSVPVKTNTAKIVGFHGRYGGYLDSIGAVLEPK